MSNKPSFIRIEQLSYSHLSVIAAMSVKLWDDCDLQEELEQWKNLIDSPKDFCALALVKDQYAGFIHVSVRSEYVEGVDHDKVAYLEGIYVEETFRHQQVGSSLLAASEAWARSLGLSQMASDTDLENTGSQQFHLTSGFREVIQIVCYVKDL